MVRQGQKGQVTCPQVTQIPQNGVQTPSTEQYLSNTEKALTSSSYQTTHQKTLKHQNLTVAFG